MQRSRKPLKVRIWRRVRVLLLLDGGHTVRGTAIAVGGYPREIPKWASGTSKAGCSSAQRRTRPKPDHKLDSSQEAAVVALVCGPPPHGQARWSTRLIAEEVSRRGIVDSIGREAIRVMLPARFELRKNVVRAEIDRVRPPNEDVLRLHARPTARVAVVCLRAPVQLLTRHTVVPMRPAAFVDRLRVRPAARQRLLHRRTQTEVALRRLPTARKPSRTHVPRPRATSRAQIHISSQPNTHQEVSTTRSPIVGGVVEAIQDPLHAQALSRLAAIGARMAEMASLPEGAQRNLHPRAVRRRQHAARRIDIDERHSGSVGAPPAFSQWSIRRDGDGHQTVSAGHARLVDHSLNGIGVAVTKAVQDLRRRRCRPDGAQHDVRPLRRPVEHDLKMTVRRPRGKHHAGRLLDTRMNAPG